MTPPVASGTLPRTVAPRAPRRVSGPAARPRRGEDARRAPRRAAPDPFILRAVNRTLALSDSRFLDRLIRGRLWIPVVAAALMGIVFMQVSMLKLNAGIGRAVQSAGTLERQNSTLRADVSRMESGSKIDAVAKSLGMVAPAATTSPSYVTASTSGVADTAARRMTAADPDAILRSKQATALANGQSTAGLTTSGTATATAGAATTAATGAATQQTAAAPAVQSTAPAPQQTAAAPAAQQTAAAPTTTGATTGTGTATGTAAPPQQTAAAPTGAATGAVTPPGPQGTTASTTAGGAVAPAAG
jgi:hypothetical protein